MENCLFVANLPQSLNNYELTVALYLVFSRYGKVTVVKASRDSSHRPFGFVEFNNFLGCREAIEDNSTGAGIIIGGRRIRLEMAKNTSKLFIKIPKDFDRETAFNCLLSLTNCKLISNPIESTFFIKLDSNFDHVALMERIKIEYPDWNVQLRNDGCNNNDYLGNFALSSSQRQSGLFQLRIPESGVLPVAPATMAKINSYSPSLQYSLTPLEQSILPITPPVMNRLYEDWHSSGLTETFRDSSEAREVALRLVPPLGEWEGDVFIGRLDNQRVSLESILELTQKYGEVSFIRLCNRAVTREDRVPVDSTAFIRFKDTLTAKKFLQSENGATWLGRIIKCEKCWSFMGRGPTPPISLGTEMK